MATYDEWNKAIAEYFVSGLSSGTTVYLSVDEQALVEIGTRFEQPEDDYVDWVEDFIEAVKLECIIGNIVYLGQISKYQSDLIPRCVVFLAAMVLAAYHMIGEETDANTISQINYFTRLRQVLGLPHEEGGRPEGLLPAGVEENLWQIWNRWLISNGLLPSAEHGRTGYNKYINYPLSQALLREADKDSLEHLFCDTENIGQLRRTWDRDTVGSWVRKQQFGSRHLRELVQENDFRRYEAITDAVYDVYTSIDWDQEIGTKSGVRLDGQRRLTAQLYRVENPITGEIDYHLYPRQLRQFSGGTLEVIQNGHAHPLSEERQGWFMPLRIPLRTADLAGGMSYVIRGNPKINDLILPERGFWILIRDPENEASGDFAGWGHPGLGERFLLLCRKKYKEQMEDFKQEALLEWDREFLIDDEWIEYQECKITSPSWEGIIPQHQDLYDALKPNVSATILLTGGLRVPNQGGWLEGYVPEITIVAFHDSIQLELLDASCPDKPVMDRIVNTNKPIVDFLSIPPGDYLLKAHSLGELITQRVYRILPWDSLECRQPKQPFSVDVKAFTLQGAIINVFDAEGQEEE